MYILCIIHYSPSFTLCIQNINNTNCNSKSINCDLSSIWLQVHTAVFNFCMLSLKQKIHPLINCCTEQRIIISAKKNQPTSVYDFNISDMFTSLFILIPCSINHRYHRNHNKKRYLPTYEQYNNYNAVVCHY